jgi:hypothetical protein
MSEAQALSLQERLDALRSDGSWRRDPARFHYMEALARRLPDQPETVRRLLEAKLNAALADYAERLAEMREASGEQAEPLRPGAESYPACAGLAQLNEYIRHATAARRQPSALGETPQEDELASVRAFRQVWSSRRAEQQVEGAVSRKPANPGPLNSHGLVLDLLSTMRELSPDYLRRFLTHVETLQWLEQAAGKYGQKQSTPARRRRGK